MGGKNASLGEMIQALNHEGIRVPDGFATTAAAFLVEAGIDSISLNPDSVITVKQHVANAEKKGA